MQKIVLYTEQIPNNVKVVSDIGVWGVVAAGWLSFLQPWLTALATVLAIAWSSIQIYSHIQIKYKQRKKHSG